MGRNETKTESLPVQKTPAHRTGERAVLKERSCKGKDQALPRLRKVKVSFGPPVFSSILHYQKYRIYNSF